MVKAVHVLIIIFVVVLMSNKAESTERAFEKTDVGKIEVKVIPESKLLVADSEGRYFDKSNQLFYLLFNYIKKHNVTMTTPVEADIEKANMRFYVGTKDSGKELQSEDEVEVIIFPERKVASIGARGSYSEQNVNKSRVQLEEWLKESPLYSADGPVYGVYWNSPFTPWFLKRFEVHIPVKMKQN